MPRIDLEILNELYEYKDSGEFVRINDGGKRQVVISRLIKEYKIDKKPKTENSPALYRILDDGIDVIEDKSYKKNMLILTIILLIVSILTLIATLSAC